MRGPSDRTVPSVLDLRPATVATLVLLALLLVAWKTAHFLAASSGGGRAKTTDFDAFHLAGRMAWEGNIEGAHFARVFVERQSLLSEDGSFMPWTYPPQFDLVVAGLALLPIWLAYAAFTSLTFGAYLLVLRRLSPRHFPVVLVASLCATYITIRSGQNGFLTASLIGGFVLLSLRGSRWAGLPLGLMVIKPHLALGLGLFLLLARRWAEAALALAVVGASALLSTLAFGIGIWPAFLNGLQESKLFLEAGLYPLYRMVSVYAGLRTLGAGAGLALGLHLLMALGGLAMLVLAVVRKWQAERVLAVAILASLTVSPYLYDYDLTLLALVLALSAGDLLAVHSRRVVLVILGLVCVAGGYGFVGTAIVDLRMPQDRPLDPADLPLAVGAFALAALTPMLLATLWKAERGGARTRAARDPVPA